MKIKLSIAAILTGDIVNSTRLSPQQERKLFDLLKKFAAKNKYEFFRGDSFQIYMDDLGDTRRLAISCGNEIANIGLEVIADYLDNIYQGMTGKQAELITNLLRGTTQQQVAVTLNKSKSTVSQLAAAGRWPEIEKLLQQYKAMIEKLYPSL